MEPQVAAVSRSATHSMSKPTEPQITLLAGLGVDGDTHAGVTVQHRARVARNPDQPNLRQVHLIHEELFTELLPKGFAMDAGVMGENVTTRNLDILGLPVGTRLRLGDEALIEITGLRNPCALLDDIQPGLMKATLDRDEDGNLIRKAGVMAVVLASGVVHPEDMIEVILPAEPHTPLQPV